MRIVVVPRLGNARVDEGSWTAGAAGGSVHEPVLLVGSEQHLEDGGQALWRLPGVGRDAGQHFDRVDQIGLGNEDRRPRGGALEQVHVDELHGEAEGQDGGPDSGRIEGLFEDRGEVHVELLQIDQVGPQQAVDDVEVVAELLAALGPATRHLPVRPLYACVTR